MKSSMNLKIYKEKDMNLESINAEIKAKNFDKLKTLLISYPDPNDWDSRTAYFIVCGIVKNLGE